MTCIDLAYARSWVERRDCLFLHQLPPFPLGCLWIGLSRLSRIPASPKSQRLVKEAIGIRLLLSLALGNKPTLDPSSTLPAPSSHIRYPSRSSSQCRSPWYGTVRSAAPASPISSDYPRELHSAARSSSSSPLGRQDQDLLVGMVATGRLPGIVHPNCVREAAGFALCRDAGRSSMAQTREKSTGCCSYSVIMMSCLNHSDPCGQYRSPFVAARGSENWLVIILPLLPASFAVCSCPPPQE
jgi:hypothetical protein